MAGSVEAGVRLEAGTWASVKVDRWSGGLATLAETIDTEVTLTGSTSNEIARCFDQPTQSLNFGFIPVFLCLIHGGEQAIRLSQAAVAINAHLFKGNQNYAGCWWISRSFMGLGC
jgi:hypothetical protein